MRLVLHVGTHKTGTTAFQDAMSAQRAELARGGVIYPDERPDFGQKSSNHKYFARAVGGDPAAAREFVARVAREAPEGAAILLSAEAFYRLHGDSDDFETFDAPDYWQRRGAYLQSLAEITAPLGPATPVIVLRERAGFAESLYGELVRQGLVRTAFAPFIRTYRHWFDYERQCAALEAAFGSVAKIEYADALRDGVAESIFAAADLPLGFDVALASKRRSYDVRLTLWLLETMLGAEGALRRHFTRSAEAAALFSGRVTLWNADERAVFAAQFGVAAPEAIAPTYAGLTPEDRSQIESAFQTWAARQRPR